MQISYGISWMRWIHEISGLRKDSMDDFVAAETLMAAIHQWLVEKISPDRR